MKVHKCVFTVTRTCQGTLQYREQKLTLLQALVRYYRQVRKYGKYGTMRFDIEGW